MDTAYYFQPLPDSLNPEYGMADGDQNKYYSRKDNCESEKGVCIEPPKSPI